MEKRDAGVAISILALLVILGGAGEYNYQRNRAAEERAAPRSFRGHSDEEIAALIQAYQQEVETLESRYATAKSRDLDTRSGGLLGDQVREFERAQRAGDLTRSLGGDVAQREAVLRELRREQSLRAGGLDSLKVHLRRLFSLG
jgi:hypothetical protein